jgi:hypothetical protein
MIHNLLRLTNQGDQMMLMIMRNNMRRLMFLMLMMKHNAKHNALISAKCNSIPNSVLMLMETPT